MTMTVDGTPIGLCLFGTEVSMVDYSRKERDPFGNITIIPRGYSDVVTYAVDIDTHETDQVRTLLASKRAVKALYVGTVNNAATIVEGYLNNFTINMSDWNTSQLSLEVESEVITP